MAPVVDDRDGTRFENCLLIKGVAGYEVDGQIKFGDSGDSGSPVLDLANNLVGIYTGHYSRRAIEGDETSPLLKSTYVCHIEPALKALAVNSDHHTDRLRNRNYNCDADDSSSVPDERERCKELHDLCDRR